MHRQNPKNVRPAVGGATAWAARLLGVLLAFALFWAAAPLRMAIAQSTAPPRTTSWYIDISDPTTLSTKLYNMGCNLGKHDYNTAGAQDNVVVLLFGKPAYVNGKYGARAWTARGSSTTVFLSTSRIAAGVEQFGKGYYVCSGSDKASQLYVAAGVSNYGKAVTYEHGSAWAKMALAIQSWINSHGYGSQVFIRSAADLELSFNSNTSTRAWVDGYTASWNSGPYLYDVGDAAGCPSPQYPTWDCGSTAYPSWTSEDVYYIAWGAGSVYPIPEIYLTNGVNAGQWYYLSLYSYLQHGSAMWFAGELTQYQACQQMGGCTGTNNRPAQGWNQLWNAIQADSRTAQSYLRWSTDMKWR